MGSSLIASMATSTVPVSKLVPSKRQVNAPDDLRGAFAQAAGRCSHFFGDLRESGLE